LEFFDRGLNYLFFNIRPNNVHNFILAHGLSPPFGLTAPLKGARSEDFFQNSHRNTISNSRAFDNL
jgi:hypothetical protein